MIIVQVYKGTYLLGILVNDLLGILRKIQLDELMTCFVHQGNISLCPSIRITFIVCCTK